LSGNYFNATHEASQADLKKISSEILSDDDKIRVYDILSKFPDIRRDLAIYGYYEQEGVTKSPYDIFNNIQTNYADRIPVLQIKESLRVPSESLLLKRYFG
jgi:hypothetical protein